MYIFELSKIAEVIFHGLCIFHDVENLICNVMSEILQLYGLGSL